MKYSLWIALNSPLNSHGCPGTLSHIKMFLSSVLKREGSGIAPVLLFCVTEELLQHDRFCHLRIFCVIRLWRSCLSTFTTEDYSLRVWLKLQLPGVLRSKPNEDLAIVMHLAWHSGRCSLLLLSLWHLLTPLYILYIWRGFQQVRVFGLKFKPGTEDLCGLPSVLKGLRQQRCHNQCHYNTSVGQKMWWGIERKGQEPCKKKVGEAAAMGRTREGKRKCVEILRWGKTEMKIWMGSKWEELEKSRSSWGLNEGAEWDDRNKQKSQELLKLTTTCMKLAGGFPSAKQLYPSQAPLVSSDSLCLPKGPCPVFLWGSLQFLPLHICCFCPREFCQAFRVSIWCRSLLPKPCLAKPMFMAVQTI